MLTGIIPGTLKETVGDASLPAAGGHRIVANIVNLSGEWGDGVEFNEALSNRWPQVKQEYRRGYYAQRYFKIGMLQEIGLKSDLIVANLIVMDGTQVQQDALQRALKDLATLAKSNGSSVHLQFDSVWKESEELVKAALIDKGINVFFYTSADSEAE